MKNLLNDNKNMMILPISLFDSFYFSDETRPIKLKSVDYKVI